MALVHDEVEQEERFSEDFFDGTDRSRDGSVDVIRDRILVERCQAGDRMAFDELYLRYQRRLHRFCMQRLGEAHDAEDVVQESFVKAWGALPRFAGERRFYPWLTVIAANLCVDTIRRRSRQTPVEESRITAFDIGCYDIEDAVLHEVDSQTVALAFGHLSTRHQRVLQLREGFDWSYQKIAEHEGVGVTAVETLLWRARQALKREFLMLDEQRNKLGALIGFLVVLPTRMVMHLPKAIEHTVDYIRQAVGGLGTGKWSAFGTSGAFGIFGPSLAAATSIVALTVGTVLMLPVTGGGSGTSTGSPSTVPVAVTGPPPLASEITANTSMTSGTAGTLGEPNAPSESVGVAGLPGNDGNPTSGGTLGLPTTAGAKSGVLGTLGAANGGPVGGVVHKLRPTVTSPIDGVIPKLGTTLNGLAF